MEIIVYTRLWSSVADYVQFIWKYEVYGDITNNPKIELCIINI
jgi:hypothetical protein